MRAVFAYLILASHLLIAQDRVALVVGNGNYSHGSKLVNPANDARSVHQALTAAGFKVSLLIDAKLSEMEQSILSFKANSRGAKAAWVFYAGHGIEVKGSNYLLPIDADLSDESQVRRKSIALDEVLENLDEANAPLKVIVLDCCRDDPFRRSWSRSSKGGLAQIESTPSGTIIAYSSAPGKTAADGEGLNSPYSAALVAAMTIPGLEIEQIFKEAGKRVISETKGDQQPWVNSSFYDTFIMIPGPNVNTPGNGNTSVVKNADKNQSEPPSIKMKAEPVDSNKVDSLAPDVQSNNKVAENMPTGKMSIPSIGANSRSKNVIIETTRGLIELELYEELAPLTVKNFLSYVESGFYDGTIFHRCIPDFMIQGGGFTPDMNQKAVGAPISIESKNGLKNDRGTIAMARTSDPNSATSQFFINVKENVSLDYPSFDGYGYAVFGKVTKGLEICDAIVSVPTGRVGPHGDVPSEPILIKSVKVAE
jgi:cyclophilin family peptidyl-prolyl cis-trans isomerase